MNRFKGLLARKVIAAVMGVGLVAGASLVYGVQTIVSGQPASFTIQRQSPSNSSKSNAPNSNTPVNYQTAKVSGEVHATVTGLPNIMGMIGGGIMGNGGILGGLTGGKSATPNTANSPGKPPASPGKSSAMSFGANGSGAVNLATGEGEGSIHIDGFMGSILGGPVQVRVTGGTAYLSVPVLSMFDGGKPWVSIQIPQSLLAAMPQLHSFYYTQPGGWLDLLKPVSSSITDVGTATVNGHSTTIYKATINVATVLNDIMQYIKSTISIPSKMQSRANTLIKTLESDLHASVDLYVGGSGLVRRVTGSLTGTFPSLASIMGSASGSTSSGKLQGTALGNPRQQSHSFPALCPRANTTTPAHCIKLPKLPLPKPPSKLPKLPTSPITLNVEGALTFSSFGAPVSVTAPSASQTVTASSLVASIMKLFNSFKGMFGGGGSCSGGSGSSGSSGGIFCSGSGSTGKSGSGGSGGSGSGDSGGLGGILGGICSGTGPGSSSGSSSTSGSGIGGILNGICNGSSGGGFGGIFGGSGSGGSAFSRPSLS